MGGQGLMCTGPAPGSQQHGIHFESSLAAPSCTLSQPLSEGWCHEGLEDVQGRVWSCSGEDGGLEPHRGPLPSLLSV